MRTFLRLNGLVLGMLMLFTGSCPNMELVQVVSIAPIDNPVFAETGGTAAAIPAFPGAEGFGANSVGGRGGRVIEVINLNDSGPGSLRAAIEAEGSRIVIFRTGGTIELQSGLNIHNPFITIAGQTAPGGGITLRHDPSRNTGVSLGIWTHDVIVRYLGVRPGPSIEESCCVDGVSIQGGHDIILDHVSASWAVDENVNSWYDPHDFTIQWSIISEGLYNSTHEQGPHSLSLIHI